MIIRKSNERYTLYRYGGTAEGKNLEVRIGSVPVGTPHDRIPDEIAQDLTPRELATLKTTLERDQQATLQKKANALAGYLADVTAALQSGLLDAETNAGLFDAARELLKCARGVNTGRKSGARETPPTNSIPSVP